MKKPSAIAVLRLVSLAMAVSAPAYAVSASGDLVEAKVAAGSLPPEEAEKVPLGTVRPPTHRFLVKVEEWMAAGQFYEALERIEAFLPRTTGRQYERGLLDVARSYCLLSTEQFVRAVPVLTEVVGNRWIQASSRHDLRFNLVQIHVQEGQWTLAAPLLNEWLEAESSPEPVSLALAGYVQYQLDHYRRAASLLRRAIVENHAVPGSEPHVDWYQLLLASYQRQGDPDAARALLRSFVARFPHYTDNYLQLAQTALQLKDSALALASLDLGAAAGALSAEGIRAQVRLLVELGDPYRSASTAEQAIATGKLVPSRFDWDQLVDAWLLARNSRRAVKAAKKARAYYGGKVSPDESGESPVHSRHFVLRAGEILLRQEHWLQAARMVEPVLAVEGAAADRAHAHLLLGVSQLQQGLADKSFKNLTHAKRAPAEQVEAKRWLQYWHGRFPEASATRKKALR